ncbi:choice-of-anchor G family protein, partial [Candidatus Microthrix parvicella]|uniref:choice-of-anchor G family protein n=1 Tax=Candidatus Neomicrothrix parvicella TaxID=41950 RepID=UPI0012FDF86D
MDTTQPGVAGRLGRTIGGIGRTRPGALQRFRLGRGVRIAAALMLVLGTLAGTQQTAGAVPGDTSNAEGQFLSGTLLAGDLALVASLAGETATSDGTASQTNSGNLDLGALGLVNLTIPGGVQVPLEFTNAGVVGQYASALDDGSSLGSSGLIQSDGTIGTGGTPRPGVAPGPLSLSLGGVVSDLGLNPALLAEVAQLGLQADTVSAQASLAAPGSPVGAYSIDDLKMNFQSATLAALVGEINSAVAVTQGEIDGLDAALDASVGALLGPLSPLVVVDVNVTPPDLSAAIAGLTSGTISDPAFPGVTVDLDTGLVTVDLDELTSLNGLPANTDILTDATITAITTNLTGLLQAHLVDIQDTLLAAVDATAITGGASILGTDILTLNTTVGAVRAGDTTGIALLGVGLGLPGGLTAVLGALNTPITAVTDTLTTLSDDLFAPVLANVVPALKPVLDEAVGITVNNQSTSGGVFTETALRITVLPVADALTLDVATARVGPNSLAPPPVVTDLTPPSGPTAGGTVVTITGSGFTGATGVTFDGTPGTSINVISDTEIEITSPPHAAGPTDVVVTTPVGASAPGTFTFVPPPVVTDLTPPSGPTAGGTVVTITGSGFTGATGVTFDGTPGTSINVISDTEIEITSPPHAAGPTDVVVTTPVGASAPGTFTFVPPPVVTDLTPPSGPTAGGTVVTITGSGFTGATGVTFDGTPGTSINVISDTEIEITSPPHAAGPTDVVVTTPGGVSAPGTFTFVPPPVVTDLTPPSGPTAGGTVVT